MSATWISHEANWNAPTQRGRVRWVCFAKISTYVNNSVTCRHVDGVCQVYACPYGTL